MSASSAAVAPAVSATRAQTAPPGADGASRRSFALSIDTGGTFTDGFVSDGEHTVQVKVDTTPQDLTIGFAACIEAAAAALGEELGSFLSSLAQLHFSSTVATNTIVERRGASVGLIVTAGAQAGLYGSLEQAAVLNEFVDAELVRGITEQVDADGAVIAEPAPGEIELVVRELLERGVRLLVLSFANADLNPANELRARAIIDRSYPRHYLGAVPLLMASRVSLAPDDFGRTATAVINAYLHPRLARTLYTAEDGVRDRGLTRPLLIVNTDGATSRVAKTRAIDTYDSGPGAGVLGAGYVAAELGARCVCTFDVGGTTTDVALLTDAGVPVRDVTEVGPLVIPHPSVAITSFGLGGGSVISVAVDGTIGVGPESAGASPGPACYGLGGDRLTPTDIWLLLGYLQPGEFLGGRRRLDPDAAGAAAARCAQALGVGVQEALLRGRDAIHAELAARLRGWAERHPQLSASAPDDRWLFSYGGGGGAPRMQVTDVKARVAACDRVRVRLQDLARRKGTSLVRGLFRRLIQQTSAGVRRRIEQWPDGVYRHIVFMDTTGHEDGLLRASVAVTVQGGRLTLDFSGTSPEHEGSYNAFTNVIRGHCAVGLYQFPFHDFPISSGMFDHIDIRVPHGSFFDADPEAAISCSPLVGAMVFPLLGVALSKVMYPSEQRSLVCGFTSSSASAVIVAGTNQHGVRVTDFMGYPLNAYGLAARSDRDGIDVWGFPHGPWGKAPDVEDIESEFPLLHLYQKQQRDTCGFGMYRGGVGAAVGYVVYGTSHLAFTSSQKESRFPAHNGMFGGYSMTVIPGIRVLGSDLLELMAAGEPNLPTDDYSLAGGDTALSGEVIIEHQTRGIRILQEGDVLAASTQGSGGYGDVLERDPQAVIADLRADIITDWTAREVFGVVYDSETLLIDETATRALRQEHRDRRLASQAGRAGRSPAARDVVQWSLLQLVAAGKRPTLAPAIDGFLVNRLQYALIREALALVRMAWLHLSRSMRQ